MNSDIAFVLNEISFCSPDRNRTCIKSLGNFYSIHWTTGPVSFSISSSSCRLKILFSRYGLFSRFKFFKINQFKRNIIFYWCGHACIMFFQSFLQYFTMTFIIKIKILAFYDITIKHTTLILSPSDWRQPGGHWTTGPREPVGCKNNGLPCFYSLS